MAIEESEVDLLSPPPTVFAPNKDEPRSITVGDLHANPLLLLQWLMRFGIFYADDAAQIYEDLKKLITAHQVTFDLLFIKIKTPGKALIAEALASYKEVLKLIKVDDRDHFRLIGDVTGDRGPNDLFTMLMLNKVDNFSYIFGNHDVEMAFYRASGCRVLPETGMHKPYTHSIQRLHDAIQSGVIDREAFCELYDTVVKPRLLLIDCEISIDEAGDESITIYSHAPISLRILPILAEKYGIQNYSIETPQAIKALIEEVNDRFQATPIEEQYRISSQYDYLQNVNKENVLEYCTWNRWFLPEDVEDVLKERTFKIDYIHGHTNPLQFGRDPYSGNVSSAEEQAKVFKRMHSLDSSLGKTKGSSNGSAKVEVRHPPFVELVAEFAYEATLAQVCDPEGSRREKLARIKALTKALMQLPEDDSKKVGYYFFAESDNDYLSKITVDNWPSLFKLMVKILENNAELFSSGLLSVFVFRFSRAMKKLYIDMPADEKFAFARQVLSDFQGIKNIDLLKSVLVQLMKLFVSFDVKDHQNNVKRLMDLVARHKLIPEDYRKEVNQQLLIAEGLYKLENDNLDLVGLLKSASMTCLDIVESSSSETVDMLIDYIMLLDKKLKQANREKTHETERLRKYWRLFRGFLRETSLPNTRLLVDVVDKLVVTTQGLFTDAFVFYTICDSEFLDKIRSCFELRNNWMIFTESGGDCLDCAIDRVLVGFDEIGYSSLIEALRKNPFSTDDYRTGLLYFFNEEEEGGFGLIEAHPTKIITLLFVVIRLYQASKDSLPLLAEKLMRVDACLRTVDANQLDYFCYQSFLKAIEDKAPSAFDLIKNTVKAKYNEKEQSESTPVARGLLYRREALNDGGGVGVLLQSGGE